jgi:DNA-binding MarR family transcriptional regulator
MERSDVLKHKDDEILESLSLAEVHCIDCIGTIAQPNVTKIASDMRLTRGAISKVSRKLSGKALIESYQDPSNRKEVYFRLTKSGQAVFRKHQKIHKDVQKAWRSLFERYSDVEQEAIRKFLSDVSGLLSGAGDTKDMESVLDTKVMR